MFGWGGILCVGCVGILLEVEVIELVVWCCVVVMFNVFNVVVECGLYGGCVIFVVYVGEVC